MDVGAEEEFEGAGSGGGVAPSELGLGKRQEVVRVIGFELDGDFEVFLGRDEVRALDGFKEAEEMMGRAEVRHEDNGFEELAADFAGKGLLHRSELVVILGGKPIGLGGIIVVGEVTCRAELDGFLQSGNSGLALFFSERE